MMTPLFHVFLDDDDDTLVATYPGTDVELARVIIHLEDEHTDRQLATRSAAVTLVRRVFLAMTTP